MIFPLMKWVFSGYILTNRKFIFHCLGLVFWWSFLRRRFWSRFGRCYRRRFRCSRRSGWSRGWWRPQNCDRCVLCDGLKRPSKLLPVGKLAKGLESSRQNEYFKWQYLIHFLFKLSKENSFLLFGAKTILHILWQFVTLISKHRNDFNVR